MSAEFNRGRTLSEKKSERLIESGPVKRNAPELKETNESRVNDCNREKLFYL